MTKEQREILIARHLEATITAEEAKVLATWLKKKSRNERELEEYVWLWNRSNTFHFPKKVDVEKDLLTVHEKVGIKKRGKRAKMRIFQLVAAILVLPILIAYLYWGVDWFRNEIYQQATINTIICPLGETMKVELPDGSLAFLNAGSQISFPLNFDNLETREVTLNGEALFEVVKDKEHPFIVDLGTIEIQVLGTIFNVSNYSEDSETEIFLKEGSIELIGSGNQNFPINNLKMTPSQLARIATNGKLLELKKADVDSYGDWRYGVLTFNDDSMEDVVRKLIRKYDVYIDFPDVKSIDSRINGSFENKTIEEVLDVLQYTTSISYKVKNTNTKAKKHIIMKSH